MTETQQQFATTFPAVNFEFDKPLAPMTYFKLGGNAEIFLETADESLIGRLAEFAQQNQIPYRVFGGGSNVLVPDEGVPGLTLKIALDDIKEVGADNNGKRLVQAGAGIKTALLVSQTVALGLTGLEYFLGVPGTLGGAVYNNSHYLEDLIGEHITRVQVVKDSQGPYWLANEECDFGYDHSRFHSTKEVILRVEFALANGDRETSQALIRKATEYRAQTQPLGPPSSGCIFRNTPNTPELRKRFPQFAERSHVPAGFLIDQAGLKGASEGGVVVSDKHAAWMINTGDASAKEVISLVNKVKQTVKEKFGVELQEEIFLLK